MGYIFRVLQTKVNRAGTRAQCDAFVLLAAQQLNAIFHLILVCQSHDSVAEANGCNDELRRSIEVSRWMAGKGRSRYSTLSAESSRSLRVRNHCINVDEADVRSTR